MSDTDPTLPMRQKACAYPNVDEGTACTQSSFKVLGKPFLFAGPQGGRYKAMFKLDTSRAEAAELAKQYPNNFDISTNIWVTARFSAEEPMREDIWSKWLDESYALSSRKIRPDTLQQQQLCQVDDNIDNNERFVAYKSSGSWAEK